MRVLARSWRDLGSSMIGWHMLRRELSSAGGCMPAREAIVALLSSRRLCSLRLASLGCLWYNFV